MATEVLGTAQAGCLFLGDVHRINYSWCAQHNRNSSVHSQSTVSVSVSPLRALIPNRQPMPLGSYSQCPHWNPDILGHMHHNHDDDCYHWNNTDPGCCILLGALQMPPRTKRSTQCDCTMFWGVPCTILRPQKFNASCSNGTQTPLFKAFGFNSNP